MFARYLLPPTLLGLTACASSSPRADVPAASASEPQTSASAAAKSGVAAPALHVEVEILDDQAAEAILGSKESIAKLTTCFRAELRDDPTTTIEWAGSFITDATGHVASVDLFAGFHEHLLDCIVDTVKTTSSYAGPPAPPKKTFFVKMWTGDHPTPEASETAGQPSPSKAPFGQIADQVCACKDKPCFDALAAKHEGDFPAKGTPEERALTDGERKAIARMVGCAKSLVATSDTRTGDEKILDFMTENDAFASAVKRSKSGAETRGIFKAHAVAIATKYAIIKDLRGFEVEDATTKRLADSMTASVIAVCDPKAVGFDKSVCESYTTLFK